MDTTKDNRLFETYLDMRESMVRSTKDRAAAELLFWYTAYPLVAQSKIAEKNDVLGIVMNKFMGDGHGCNEVYHAVTDLTSEYVLFNKEYGLSDKLSELGEHWKKIFWNDRFGQVLILRGWLKIFINECMPAINETIAACENEWKDLSHNMLTEKDLKARQRAYSAYKRKLQSLLNKLDIVKELHDLDRENPDYYKNEE